ncbi:MAG: ATP-binding cassette domain-containing protein [Firmicutes bacterium]|nr:ATP-binding cassette domain-containing protein [Bacillota bacterium]
MLEFDNVFYNYDKRRFDAIKGISFALDLKLSNTSIALYGGEGSGKTTLLKLATGLLKASSGHISYKGVPLSHLKDLPFSYIPTDLMLQKNKTVFDNIAYPLRYRRVDTHIISESVKDASRQISTYSGVDFKSLMVERVQNLTDYQQALVALARAIVRRPNLILIDNIASVSGATLVESGESLLESGVGLVESEAHNTTILDVIKALSASGQNIMYATDKECEAEFLGFTIWKLDYGMLEIY